MSADIRYRYSVRFKEFERVVFLWLRRSTRRQKHRGAHADGLARTSRILELQEYLKARLGSRHAIKQEAVDLVSSRIPLPPLFFLVLQPEQASTPLRYAFGRQPSTERPSGGGRIAAGEFSDASATSGYHRGV